MLQDANRALEMKGIIIRKEADILVGKKLKHFKHYISSTIKLEGQIR